MSGEELPQIIQGGMGVGVSSWRLARAVACEGLLGVVSGTALDVIVARRLQLGDQDGSVRRALTQFPWPEMAQRVLDAYFVPGGKAPDAPFKATPTLGVRLSRAGLELLVVANFVEVFLAREGHDGPIGINYLEKIQTPTLPSLFGAMAAGVSVVLMGAGIPLAIPGILDRLSRWETVELRLAVTDGRPDDAAALQRFDPRELVPAADRELPRPRFLAIVASETVARTMLRRASGEIHGFVVEGHRAGGHNAPPRRVTGGERDEDAAPAFGPRDEPDLERFRALGKPFWLAGAHASPEGLKRALEAGARGIQVGTVFAFCDESGTRADLKRRVLAEYVKGRLSVRTDFRASPTGYPFKLIEMEGTTADAAVVDARPRVCDLGYLREAYIGEDGEVRFRCAGEPVGAFRAKGGDPALTEGKQCLCNGLLATIGLGQVRRRRQEPPMLTAGDDLSFLDRIPAARLLSYSARDVIAYLRQPV